MNAPLDPRTLFNEGLEAYFGPLILLVIFFFIVVKNPLVPRSSRKFFLLEGVLLFVLILASWSDKVLEGFGDDGIAYLFRRMTTFLNFAFSPLTCVLPILLYRKRGFSRIDFLLVLPEFINVILCLFSLNYPVVFFVTPINGYSRSPFFFFPFAVDVFYAGVVGYYSTKQVNKPDSKFETTAVFVLFGCIFTAVIIQMTLQLRFLIWSTAVLAVSAYYIFLCYGYVIYDQLTGAYSRDGFRLTFLTKKAKAGVLAMIDLNRLKQINDNSGHESGDKALFNISQILLHAKAKNARLYRYGGDEFVLVAPQGSLKAVQVMLAKCEIDAGALEPPLSFSYGVVEVSEGDDLFSRLEEADFLMYEMKRRYKGEIGTKPIIPVGI